MIIDLLQVDAFTAQPFSGNPAAVCFLSTPMPEEWMQSVAQEMNLAETAFLYPQPNGYHLRWFTPTVEEDLCGHATLASAHALWETGRLAREQQACFFTRSGLLTATYKGDFIELDFPAEPAYPTPIPQNLPQALGVLPIFVGKNRFDYLVEVASEDIVKNMKPDLDQISHLPSRGVIVTSLSSTEGYDFVSRFFAPREGISEDPVTGSAHCCLGPYWGAKLAKDELIAYQASQRGGFIHVRSGGERVYLAGQAVTVFRGVLFV